MFIVIKNKKLPAGRTCGTNEGLCIFENLFEMRKFAIRLVRLVVDAIDPESDFALDVVGRQQRSESFPERGFLTLPLVAISRPTPLAAKCSTISNSGGWTRGAPSLPQS